MFEEFIINNNVPEKTITIDFSKNMFISEENIKDYFSDIDNMDDKSIYDLFIKYFNEILDSIFNLKDAYMLSLFVNSKFISIATKAAYSLTITDGQRKKCNKLAYDYLIKKQNRDAEISNLLMSFSKVINKDVTPRLCGLGLTSDLSSLIALSRFSSEKEILNTKRLNKILMRQPPKIMTEQMIVDIYCILYKSALSLFEGCMYDVYSNQNMNDNENEIYGTITLAMLDIINELPKNLIKEVLIRFTDNNKILYQDNNLRFNIESFSPEDYPRLIEVIDQLKSDDIFIPR